MRRTSGGLGVLGLVGIGTPTEAEMVRTCGGTEGSEGPTRCSAPERRGLGWGRRQDAGRGGVFLGHFLWLAVCLSVWPRLCGAYAPADVKLDEKAKQLHRIDSLNILAYTCLLILTVCTIWLFKWRRARFIHETGLALVYGLIVGAIIRYVGDAENSFFPLKVIPDPNNQLQFNSSGPSPPGVGQIYPAPPDSVWVPLMVADKKGHQPKNKTYVYVFRGELQRNVQSAGQQDISQKATFDPEIFFNIILPPIIFHAGYSLKRRFFFRNMGAIMTYAFIGTTISCFVVGVILYGFIVLIPTSGFSFNDCLYFGAIISATDPVTVLAIFHDLHVDVTLYALVFGESILNDAVAIVLAGSIDTFVQLGEKSDGRLQAAGQAFANFLYVFLTSFTLGSFVGCCTALLTKYTRLSDFPVLESSLFVLMSYSTFLMSEVLELSGIVAVLFCGICQAHYTFNNLSPESRNRTKQLFELLNFLAENFIFTYIGVSMFTYPRHRWILSFILMAFVAILCGRALNIYPLSFILNLGRNNKIPLRFQHVLFFSGLRGAMAFALALRNTLSEARQLMLTTTSLITMATVIVCGGCTSSIMPMLGIPVGVEESEHEMLSFSGVRRSGSTQTPTDLRSPTTPQIGAPAPGAPNGALPRSPYEKAWLVRKWYNFDVRFMKPLLTNSRPTLIDTLPECCLPLARILTTTEQLSNDESYATRKRDDQEGYESDDDLVESRFGSIGSGSFNSVGAPGPGGQVPPGDRTRARSMVGFEPLSLPPLPPVPTSYRDGCVYLDDKSLDDHVTEGQVDTDHAVNRYPNYQSLDSPQNDKENGKHVILGSDNFI